MLYPSCILDDIVLKYEKTRKNPKKHLRVFFPKISEKKTRFPLFREARIFWKIFSRAQKSETPKTVAFFGELLSQLTLEFFEC